MLWIAGSKGLLGSALSRKCEGSNRVESGREVDIGDEEAVLSFMKNHEGITHIVNCAAFSQVDAAEINREEAYRTNVLGPENLAKAAKRGNARFIHISTDYVFSGPIKRALREEDSPHPCNFYGETKLEGEQRALAHSACVIRTSWLFGKGGKNFVSQLLKMLGEPKEIRLTDDQWSRFTYAPDLADAILQMKDRSGIYHFANQGAATKYEFGLAMREEALSIGYSVLNTGILPVPGSFFQTPCQRPIYSAFNTEKIEQFLPIRHWRQALREFLCDHRPVYS